MKYYITKYALTKGILEVEGEASGEHLKTNGVGGFETNFYDRDWWKDEKDAKIRAETLRLQKIENLKKQINKLETLKF